MQPKLHVVCPDVGCWVEKICPCHIEGDGKDIGFVASDCVLHCAIVRAMLTAHVVTVRLAGT